MERRNYKWNINEILRLEREYDLLQLDVNEIAKLHQRSPTAIARKLQCEDIISNYKTARGFMNSTSDIETKPPLCVIIDDNEDYSSEYIPSIYDSDSDSDSSVEIIENNNVTKRVDKLETSVSNMEGMLTKMYNFMTSNSSNLNMGYDM